MAGNVVAAPQNEQEVCVPNEKYRNPSWEAKHYVNHGGEGGFGWAGGQDLICVNQPPWGQKLASISPFLDYYQFFSGLTIFSKNFYLSWCC